MLCLGASRATPRAVLDRLNCLRIASRHKSSVGWRFKQPRWSEEEDKKLLELYAQAVREKKTPWTAFIANALGDRSFNSVRERLYSRQRGAIEYKAYRKWSQDEDSTIREKMQKGVSIADLPKYLPDRGLNAIKYRVRHLRSMRGTTREIRIGQQEDFTKDQIQRAIHTRLREQKSHSEVAAEYNCSLSNFKRLWNYRCAPLLSKNDLDSLRDRNHWSDQELNRLTELYTWTTLKRSDVILQFPSRTKKATTSVIDRLELPSVRKQRQAALKIEASGPTPVATPVTQQTPRQTLGGFEQRRTFSSSSYALWKHWRAGEDAKLLELEQQGLKPMEIAKMLEGRSLQAIRNRRTNLKTGTSAGRTKSNKPWTSEEDATILEKLRQGLKFQEMLHADIQLMIDMRLHQRKTLPEVATQLGRTYPCVQNAWTYRCIPLLSEEELRSIHAASKNLWTAKELEHLMELYNRGILAQKDIVLHFPSRSRPAVLKMIHKMKSRNEEEMFKPSEPKHASLRRSRQHSSSRGLQPARPTLSMPDSIEKTSRREFSSSSCVFFGRKGHVWSDDEDQMILELNRRGMSHRRIAEHLGGDFTMVSVTRRFRALKVGTSSGTTWRPEEIETLMQKKREGLSYQDIAAQLPGRTVNAMMIQHRTQSRRRSLPTKGRSAWTEADLQRLIEMRVKERRSKTDIAVHLGRSQKAVEIAWSRWCTKLLPKETLQELYYRDHWTHSETERLIYLHQQGLKRADIALQFPSKTLAAITLKSKQLHRRIAPMIKSKLSTLTKFDWIALKTALNPYLDKELKERERTDWTPVHTAFPQFSRTQIVKLASVMRRKRRKELEAETEQSDGDSVQVKDE